MRSSLSLVCSSTVLLIDVHFGHITISYRRISPAIVVLAAALEPTGLVPSTSFAPRGTR